ncbi:MAG: hypothetical protein HGA76_07975, partial [Candidatus Firestonebacteria bacterium]|nr:hypothetical protein [Candidatus Firestonebacteria bacterium]
AMPDQTQHFCQACFTGKYPVDFQKRAAKSESAIETKEIEGDRVLSL